MRRFTVQEIRTAAIYRFTAKRRMGRASVVALLVERANLPARTADLLAGHWLSTQYYKHGWKF